MKISNAVNSRVCLSTDEWIRSLARLGDAAKGGVYLVAGILAMQFGFGLGRQMSDPERVLWAIAAQPFARFLIALIVVGLFGYSIWRFVQAWYDTENKGADVWGITIRIGFASIGVIHALLAMEAVRILVRASSGGEANNSAHWTERLIQQPFGPALVAMAGIMVLGGGLHQLYRSRSTKFRKLLNVGEMSWHEVWWSKRLGRAGYAARGVVYLVIGGFLLAAAVKTNPDQAVGIGQALTYLAQQDCSPWVLGLVAIGFSAYGVFSAVILSRYRRIPSATGI